MGDTQTETRKYKGARNAAKGVAKMQREGWHVAAQTTHRRWWSWWTGFSIFRRKANVVTFTRYAPSAEEGATMECVPGCVLEPFHAGLCEFGPLKADDVAGMFNLKRRDIVGPR